MKMRWLSVLVLGILFGFSSSAHAEMDRGAYMNGTMRKLGRGIANIVTSPAEIVRTSTLVGRDQGVVAESTVGVAQGIWRMLLRAGTGVFEVVTFYSDVPHGFEPIMKPEFVWAENSWQEE